MYSLSHSTKFREKVTQRAIFFVEKQRKKNSKMSASFVQYFGDEFHISMYIHIYIYTSAFA